MIRKEATAKYTKDPNVNKKFKGWLRKRINRYNDIIQAVRLGRNTQVSKEVDIESKLKCARICGKSGISNGLGDYSDLDDSVNKFFLYLSCT